MMQGAQSLAEWAWHAAGCRCPRRGGWSKDRAGAEYWFESWDHTPTCVHAPQRDDQGAGVQLLETPEDEPLSPEQEEMMLF